MIYNYLVNNRTPDVAILKTPGFSLNIYPAFRFLDKCSTNIIEFMVDLSIVDISPPNVYNLSQLTQFKFKIFTGFQLSCLEHFISFFDKNSQLDSELYLNRDCDDNNYEDSMCNMDYELLITLTFPFGEKKVIMILTSIYVWTLVRVRRTLSKYR